MAQRIETINFKKIFTALKKQNAFDTTTEFSNRLGVSSQNISNIINGPGNVSFKILQGLFRAFPKINHAYIHTGREPMFFDEPGGSISTYEKAPQVITATVSSDGEEMAVYVPVKAYAGYLKGYGDPEFLGTLPAVRIPFFNIPSMRLFEVGGDSMEPTVFEKDILFCQQVLNPADIRNGRMYVVVTKHDGIVVKRLMKHRGEDNVNLYSDNKYYEPYSLGLGEIMELWYVRRRLTGQVPSPDTMEDRIYELEKLVYDLQKRLNINPGKGTL